MYYLFTPPSEHFDFGFGIYAETYQEAANRVIKSAKSDGFREWKLPVCYLQRHAAELYLKSLIVILEKKFSTMKNPEDLEIPVGKTRKRITTVHTISDLFSAFAQRLLLFQSSWEVICNTDWLPMLDELKPHIELIAKIDQSSTFFRYPNKKNSEQDRKSEVREVADPANISDFFEAAGGEKIKSLIFVDSEGRAKKGFVLNRKNLTEEMRTLSKILEILSSAHFGLRMELAEGF